ncbi:hypothetical protein [uncultured Jatrophihabitans sp.]|uniref:hypothetical protein n=1 Tax=uncultured Jatrophihabitans sp. TaxID=1610747 RepID=UPI0035CAAD69
MPVPRGQSPTRGDPWADSENPDATAYTREFHNPDQYRFVLNFLHRRQVQQISHREWHNGHTWADCILLRFADSNDATGEADGFISLNTDGDTSARRQIPDLTGDGEPVGFAFPKPDRDGYFDAFGVTRQGSIVVELHVGSTRGTDRADLQNWLAEQTKLLPTF